MKKEQYVWPVVSMSSPRGGKKRKRKKIAGKEPEAIKGDVSRAGTREAFMAYVK